MEWVDEGMIEGHWGSAGSGLLLTTGTRILLLLRSGQVREPFTWGYPGGAIPRDWETGERKNALISAHTETEEELGEGVPRYRVIAEHVNVFDDGFRYTTYIGRVSEADAERLDPPLNWESDEWRWVVPGDLAELDLHPGVEWVLDQAWSQLYDTPRGSKADRVQWQAVRRAYDRRVGELDRWIEKWGTEDPEIRKRLYDQNLQELRRRRADDLEQEWKQRVNAVAQRVGTREILVGNAWRQRVLAQPYVYHFTSYDRLPSIRREGLRGSSVLHYGRWEVGTTADLEVTGEQQRAECVFFTTPGGIGMWSKFAGDKRMRQIADQRGTYFNQAERSAGARMRAAPIALRVSTAVLDPEKLRLDKVGTIDGLYSMDYRAAEAPEDAFAVCYRGVVPRDALEWARVRESPSGRMAIGGPWTKVVRLSRGSRAGDGGDAGDWTPKLTKRKKGVAERKLAKAVVTNPALGWALLRMEPEPLLVIHVLGIRRSDPAEPWLAYVAIWPPSSSLGGAEPCLVTCEAYKAYKRIQGRLRPRVDKRSMIQPGVRGGMWRGWNVWLAPISLAVAQEVGLDT